MNSLWQIPELNLQILLYLDLKSLWQVFKVNRYLNSIDDDEYFWQLKLQTEFKMHSQQPREMYYTQMTVNALNNGNVKMLKLLRDGDVFYLHNILIQSNTLLKPISYNHKSLQVYDMGSSRATYNLELNQHQWYQEYHNQVYVLIPFYAVHLSAII